MVSNLENAVLGNRTYTNTSAKIKTLLKKASLKCFNMANIGGMEEASRVSPWREICVRLEKALPVFLWHFKSILFEYPKIWEETVHTFGPFVVQMVHKRKLS